MDIDKSLIDAILLSEKLEPVIEAGVTADDFEGPWHAVATYLWEYWRNPKFHHTVPTAAAVKRKFPDFTHEKHREKVPYLCDEILKRTRYNLLADAQADIAKALKKNDLALAEKKLTEAQHVVSSRRVGAQVWASCDNVAERLHAYEQRREKTAVYGVSSGFDWPDEWTMGWQYGDMVSFVAKRGVGKCVAHDDWVTLASGERVIARDLIGEKFRLLSRRSGDSCVSVHDAQAEFNTIETCYEIETESGRKLTRNGEHRLWAGLRVHRNKSTRSEMFGLGWRHCWELREGEYLAVTKELSCFEGAQPMPLAELKLLAYMLGDGCCSSKDLRFTQLPGSQLREFRALVQDFGCTLSPTSRENDWSIVSGGSPNEVNRLIQEHGLWGKLSIEKAIPTRIFRLPADQLCIFLSRLYGTDGWACLRKRGGGQIGYGSSSRLLIEEVQHLLMKLGISSSIYEKPKVRSWQLLIRADSILDFIRIVGIFGKEAAVERVKEAVEALAQTRGRVHIWRSQNAPLNTTWERIVSVKVRESTPTVAITVPKTHVYFTEFFEHNTWALIITGHEAQMQGETVMMVSREMSSRKLLMRYDCVHAKISYRRFRRGELRSDEEKRLQTSLRTVKKLPRFEVPDFRGPCTPSIILARAIELKCRYIIIDSVYMLDDDNGVKAGWERHENIARDLRRIAKDEERIVMISNQLTAEEDARLANLDHAGAYSQAYVRYPDVVLKLFRGADERSNNEMKMQFLKIREDEMPYEPQRILWDLDTMRFGKRFLGAHAEEKEGEDAVAEVTNFKY